MFAKVGKDCYIEPPFHANWGGHHIKLGNHVYANFNLTIADDTYVTIGDNTMIGPNVTMSSAAHPILPELRKQGYQYNLPIKIGNNCWLGAGVIILPGVTIGDGAIIGARAVVTKDVPPYTIVGGVPAKPIRKRFSDEDIAALLALKWWDLPPAQILERIKYIQSGNLAALKEMR